MKKIKSEVVERAVYILVELFKKKSLKKAVLSKPDAVDEIKTVITPKKIYNIDVLQLEIFSKDNKVYHYNIREDYERECEKIFSSHAQINIISPLGNCQYMRAKSGKETLVGDKKLTYKITHFDGDDQEYQGNNNVKNYILKGDEDFLKNLGISDKTGRIHNKMQAKYRQINKFLEHIQSVEEFLPKDFLNIYDLCCGKSYLSFAVYHYFKYIKGIDVVMKCVDLKGDVIEYCFEVAKKLGFDGMEFVCADINEYPIENRVDLVVSLHACDIATDIVLNKASANNASVILSTPCCHHELNHKINCDTLGFITRHSMLRQKLCDAATDALRLMKLESEGYEVSALELIDPEDTPKNIILKAIKKKNVDAERLEKIKEEYVKTRKFLLGEES